ncbi:SMC-Scp complex subunit ScpB [Thalassolituus maritimus]|uniref:SMC-Scp complex subunit ScpB n=1 Tax=Thalassolituus maritimus TaxID=484498 RepID=A0ABQ0A008_9GAMM
MSTPALKNIIEAALMAAGMPLSVERLKTLFVEGMEPTSGEILDAIVELRKDLLGRGVEVAEVASGFRLQVRSDTASYVARLWEEKPQRYTRALLETLALIAYRQPVTRGDIEDVRGVVVSSSTIRTLLERDWVRVVGHRDAPGRPAMYATTREFLDYFGLQSLEDLPSLMEIRELEDSSRRLQLGDDAEARQPTPTHYDFSSDEEREERGAEVLSQTEDDLAAAAALVDKVEDNVYEPLENGSGKRQGKAGQGKGEPRKVRDLSQILQRLEEQHSQSAEPYEITNEEDVLERNGLDDAEEEAPDHE